MEPQSLASILTSKPPAITSVPHLISLLTPPLQAFHLLPDELLHLTSQPSTSSALPDPKVFVRRQLQAVQLALLGEVWLTWLPAAGDPDSDEYHTLHQLLKSYFIPPPSDEPSLSPSSSTSPSSSQTQNLHWAGEIARSSLAALLSFVSKPESKRRSEAQIDLASQLFVELLQEWPLDRVASALFGFEDSGNLGKEDSERQKRERGTAVVEESDGDDDNEDDRAARDRLMKQDAWELYVQELSRVPGRVANAWGALGKPRDVPALLRADNFQTYLSESYVALLRLSLSPQILSVPLPHLAPLPPFLLPHLLPPPFPSPTSILFARNALQKTWHSLLPISPSSVHTRFLRATFAFVDGFLAKGGSVVSTTLTGVEADTTKEEKEARIAAGSVALFLLLGQVESQAIQSLLDQRMAYSVELAYAVAGWIERSLRGGEEGEVEVSKVLGMVERAWCDPASVKDAGERSRAYLTALLLSLLRLLPSQYSQTLAHSSHFLTAVSSHLSHQTPAVRLMGMMVAEEVSALEHAQDPKKRLSFGEIWEGGGEGVEVVKTLRTGVEKASDERKEDGIKMWRKELESRAGGAVIVTTPAPRVVPTAKSVSVKPPTGISATSTGPKRPLIMEVTDPSDLQPYPLPPNPSDSYLESLETDDPSLYSTLIPKPSTSSTRPRGKLRPPVYVAELGEYLRGKDPEGKKEDAEEESERVLVGLKEGEGLIRRKAGWGGEVAENAVDLAILLAGLQDQFETEEFEQYKLGIMTALVAAAPMQAAPALIEHYFLPNYTLVQRHAILSALALGSRELADLPNPKPSANRIKAPTPAPPPPSPQPITLFPSKQLPPAVHARLVQHQTPQPPGPALTLPSGALEDITASLTASALSSARDDAETSIPEARREKLLTVRRFASAPRNNQDPSTNTPAFTKIAAEFFVLPLINRLLLHLRDTASSTSRGVSPYTTSGSGTLLLDVLLLPVYLGTLAILLHAARHSPHFVGVLAPDGMELVLSLHEAAGEVEGEEKVLQAEMEVLLVVLDAVISLDGGATLMRDKVEIVGEVKEWAEEVFEREERRPQGVGPVGRAAAGVLLRIEEMLRKWRGKVGW